MVSIPHKMNIKPLLTKLQVLLICLIQFVSFAVIGQTSVKTACDHAAKLKSGTLVVVLETQSKKIAYLNKLSTDQKLSQKARNKYLKKLKAEQTFKDTSWYYIRLGYGKLYNFSKVAFIMDTSLRTFLKAPATCEYYDLNLKKISYPIGDKYICQYGHQFGSQSTNISDAWYVMDSQFHRILKPFPGQIKYNFLYTGLFTKIPKSFLDENHIRAVRGKQKPLIFAYKLQKALVNLTEKGPCN